MTTNAKKKKTSSAYTRSSRIPNVLDNLLEGCQIIGYDYRYLYLNKSATLHGKRRREELLGRTMMEAYPGIEQTEMFDVLRECMEKRIPRRMENEFVYPDGTKAWFELSMQPVPEGVFILSIDITNLKRAEAELRQSLERERFIADLLEQSEQPVGVSFPDGRLGMCNRAFCELTGYSAEELQKVNWSTVLTPPEWADPERKSLAELERTGNPVRYRKEFVRKDGRRVPIELFVHLVRGESGDAKYYYAFVTDITERNRMEIALRESEERYRLIADNAVAWIYLIAPDRRMLYMSPSCEQMTGYPPGEFLADPDLMMRTVHPEDKKAVEEYHAETLESAVSHSQEFRIITKSGETRWIDHQCFPICDETGRVIGRRGMNLDVTERKQAEEELKNTLIDLERSNKELEQFAYVASHDLQEPLRMISSYTQLLARRYKGRLDQDADEFIAYAAEGANSMQRLINDLLAYSRVGTRGKPPAPTLSGQALDRALENLKLAIEENGAEISREVLPAVAADDIQLTQLFQNLVANAIKFRSEKPLKIRIDCEARGGEWVFSVHDNGIGIDPQYFDRIFIIFQRLHERGKYPGTGIGLAVCKKIVQRHGGRIWVESESGKGSTFFFSLPRSKEHADDGTEKPADRNSSG
jgi:PAS domain S-box-containing protein